MELNQGTLEAELYEIRFRGLESQSFLPLSKLRCYLLKDDKEPLIKKVLKQGKKCNLFAFLKDYFGLGVVMHDSNSRFWEAETGGSL